MSEAQNEEVTQEEPTQDAAETEAEVAAQAEIKAVFDASLEAKMDEDDTKLALIALPSVTFKNVTRVFNKLMVDGGYMLSKEDKASHVVEALEGLDFESEDDYDLAVVALVSDEKGINERSAAALLRAYAKKNTLDIFKKPKVEGAGEPRFAQTYYDMLVANPSISEEDAKDYIMDPKNSKNTHRMLNFFQKVREVANNIAAKYETPAEDAA